MDCVNAMHESKKTVHLVVRQETWNARIGMWIVRIINWKYGYLDFMLPSWIRLTQRYWQERWWWALLTPKLVGMLKLFPGCQISLALDMISLTWTLTQGHHQAILFSNRSLRVLLHSFSCRHQYPCRLNERPTWPHLVWRSLSYQ